MRSFVFAVPSFFALACLVLNPSCVFSQQEFSGKVVTSIQYEPAQQPIDDRDLKDMQLVQTGEPLDLMQVATTIDHLFASGLYDDIRVDAEPSPGGVAIKFVTRARLFVGHVGLQGQVSDPPSRGVLLSDAQLYLGTPFNPDDVERAKRSIEQIMHENGLYQSEVGAATITDPVTHQVTVRFFVAAGKRARYQTPVIQGTPKLSNGTIIRATGWRIPLIHRWRLVTAELTDKGVEGVSKKYAKKERLTASVDVDSLHYDARTNRLTPTLLIDAGPKVTIRTKEAKLSQSKIRNLVPVYQEGAVDRDLLTEGADNITDYFQSRGYPDVDVTFRTEPPADDQQLINYYVALGQRQRLVSVDIRGGEYFGLETIRERMFLQPKSLVLRYGRYSENFRHQDDEAIKNLYLANGFRDVKVASTVQTRFKGKDGDLGVVFNIQPGAQWKVAKLEVLGSSQLDLAPIRDQFYSIEGQPFSDVNVASDRNRILSYYYDHGFLNASFSYRSSPGADPNTINLTYRIHEGPQEFIRKIILSGLNRTRTSLIDKKITIHDGDPVSITKINEISRQITDLGMFATVNSALQDADGSTRFKYLLYDFDEAARYSFKVGGGLEVGQFGRTTNILNNAGGSKGLSPIVSFDVSRLNFRGVGQTISFQVRYSSLEQRESVTYVVPRFLGSLNRTVTFSVLYDKTQDVQTFSSRRQQASIATSQRLNRASTISLRFDYRRVSTGNIQIPALLIPVFSQPVRIGIFGLSYIQDHRDNATDAHHGFWNTLDTGVASSYLGSQRDFFRVLASNSTYTQFGRNLVFARQTQFGVILPFNVPTGVSHFDAIPLPERFFGGGSISNRGFGDNQAGPRDIGTSSELPGSANGNTSLAPTGFPIGGNALFFNTLELRFPLLGSNISGVLFEDMGNIYTTFSDISLAFKQPSTSPSYQNFNFAVQAPGFGIRYKTPLGPIRVDFSYALNPAHYLGFSNSNETTQQLLNCTQTDIQNHTPGCIATPQSLSRFNFFFSIGQRF